MNMNQYISKTPLRITLFGGGTDYPSYYSSNGGKSIASSIDKYSYVILRQLSNIDPYKYRLIYSQSELCNSVEAIKQPVIRACFMHTRVEGPLEIHYFSDLPAFSGLGTSSAFVVGLLKVIYEYMGIKKNNIEIAEEAIYIERELLREIVGVQDQYTTAIGGVVYLEMYGKQITCKKMESEDNCQLKKIENNLQLYFTGITRYSQSVLVEQNERNIEGKNKKILDRMKHLTTEFLYLINNGGDVNLAGEMLNENWNLKKELSSNVTNTEINSMYTKALEAGALGGKLLGAGGGGFLMMFVPNEFQNNVSKKLSKYKKIDFNFEKSGSKVALMNNLIE